MAPRAVTRTGGCPTSPQSPALPSALWDAKPGSVPKPSGPFLGWVPWHGGRRGGLLPPRAAPARGGPGVLQCTRRSVAVH